MRTEKDLVQRNLFNSHLSKAWHIEYSQIWWGATEDSLSLHHELWILNSEHCICSKTFTQPNVNHEVLKTNSYFTVNGEGVLMPTFFSSSSFVFFLFYRHFNLNLQSSAITSLNTNNSFWTSDLMKKEFRRIQVLFYILLFLFIAYQAKCLHPQDS